MKIIKSPPAMTRCVERLRLNKKEIGFVPTMGALHAGHLALVRQARRANDVVVVSIFVNPTQFAPHEDLSQYPRPIERDKQLLKNEKVDYLFLPSASAMYPRTTKKEARVSESRLAKGLCGKFRRGHFRGVVQVVTRLFNIVCPHHVYFGAKDYQQSVIIEQLIQAGHRDICFHRVQTVREKDGLAMSSRNRYLSAEDRKRALSISQTLFWMRRQIRKRRCRLTWLKRKGRFKLRQALDKLEYLEIVDAKTLRHVLKPRREMVIAAAGYVGKTRLIDNVIIRDFSGIIES